MIRTLYTTLLIFCIAGLLVSNVSAQSPSPSPQEESVQNNIKDRVEKIMKNPTTVKSADTTGDENFGVVGTLEKMVAQTLQVRTANNGIRIIELDKQAVILRDQKLIDKEELELNSWIIVMGTIDPSKGHVGKRVLVTSSSVTPAKRQTILGVYQSSTSKNLSLIKGVSGFASKETFLYSTKTTFLNILGQTIKRSDIKENDKLLLILPEQQDATPPAKRVYNLTPSLQNP